MGQSYRLEYLELLLLQRLDVVGHRFDLGPQLPVLLKLELLLEQDGGVQRAFVPRVYFRLLLQEHGQAFVVAPLSFEILRHHVVELSGVLGVDGEVE